MKPMLACSKIPTLNEAPIPCIASPKLDGIRCLAINGKAYSRNMKLIPNTFVQQYFAEHELNGFDGELMVRGDFNKVQSSIMSTTGKPDFVYNVFDCFLRPKAFFTSRLEMLEALPRPSRVELVTQTRVTSKAQLDTLYSYSLQAGYEGLILRLPDGPYKNGRSTLREQYMLKMKPRLDAEALIIGFEPYRTNLDTSTKCKENMVEQELLGSFLVKDARGVEFNVGSGFNMSQRAEYWGKRDKLVGKYLTFYFQEYSAKAVPRFPVFKGFRDKGDM